MQTFDERVESLLRDLPDENGARVFLERFALDRPRELQKLRREAGLFSDALALVAWSPLLATTIEQNRDYLSWLARERVNPRVRTTEELKESLARFALTNSSLNHQVLLARFRRRELLRIYLHDIRRSHTLVETTEELSNLADAVLDYASSIARQDLENRYGAPRRTDERGRIAAAEFCIVALGKLGSYELNYASDIDLVFLYSDEGTTSGSGDRGEVTNREYFVRLAEAIVKLVGQPAGEGAAYRVDLRLRPHGRDGALVCSLEEATRYYRQTAQPWELQAMIRSRAAAGSTALFTNFATAVKPRVFRADVSVKEALASVRLAKQKIDTNIERRSGFNVKLSRGGIREIEFIAQALQLAHGGKDEWLRVSHTLVSLGRLADRGFITEQERTSLSAAYVFLRTLEHRLQMENGLQTHVLPEAEPARLLAAKRMGFAAENAVRDFEAALKAHVGHVMQAYNRLFAEVAITSETFTEAQAAPNLAQVRSHEPVDAETTAALSAAAIFNSHLDKRQPGEDPREAKTLTQMLLGAAHDSLNPHRSLTIAMRVASSLDKSTTAEQISEDNLLALMGLCGSSEFFGEMIAANPGLIGSLTAKSTKPQRKDYRAVLRACIDAEKSFAAELSALRRTWSKLLIEIGARDAAGEVFAFESNRLQTELAIASINAASIVARRELDRRHGRIPGGPRLAFLGLGRLASGGVDYGSDLDLIITFDSLVPAPLASLTREETYARLVELMISVLSSVTREGYLYRVDLRLRPDGQNGPLVVGTESFLEYLKERSAIWEWLAYVKMRAIGGDLELGRRIETHARHIVHENALRTDPAELKRESRRVRDRLERERSQKTGPGGIDIKYGAGGMLDVYFATRYLQLRDDVRDEGDDRSTPSTIERLEAAGSLKTGEAGALGEGYALLRSVDHQMRLIVGRSARLPAPDHPAARDIASKLGFVSASQLSRTLAARMSEIRAAYELILE